MGALAPSGRPLARAMATAAELGGKRILEIGPGTGVITEALLDAGAEPEQLSLLERDCRLASNLASKFPDLKVITGDFSSLPLLNMKKSEKHSILTQILALLDERGMLIQYSYSARPPLSENLTRELGITGMRAATVIRNLPPARVWKYSRPLN